MSGIAFDPNEKLARMAGQIADFFRAYPDEQAARSIAEHINQFWTPRMRADFLAGPAPADRLVAEARKLVEPARRADAER